MKNSKKSIDRLLNKENLKIISKLYMSALIGNDEAKTYYFDYSSGYCYEN